MAVSNGHNLGVIPEIDVLEDRSHGIFNRSGPKQETWENTFLWYFSFLRSVDLIRICRVRLKDVAAHLDVDHTHLPVPARGKCLRIKQNISGAEARLSTLARTAASRDRDRNRITRPAESRNQFIPALLLS